MMNESTTSNQFNLGLARRRYAWLAIVPVAALIIAGAIWGNREWTAARENRLQIERWTAAGIPFDDATSETAYVRRTHAEGFADWNQVSELVDWGVPTEAYKRIPYVGYDAKGPDELIPGGDDAAWPDHEFVASFLKEIKPVIDLIERASQHPHPVRFPIEFNGINTPLQHVQQSRQILQLLVLDCDYAYFKRDTDRALRDIGLMQSTAAAFDGREGIVAELIQIALQQMRTNAIRRTLTHCIWSEAELKEIRVTLSPEEDLVNRWQELVHHEMAFGLSALNLTSAELSAAMGRPIQNWPVWPSERKRMIEYYEILAQLLFNTPNQWSAQATALEKRMESEVSDDSYSGMIIPAVRAIVESEVRREDDRRWTLTAVALQQYRQQYEKWPQRLADLATIGLSRDDYSTIGQQLFGYEVIGDTAYLWTQVQRDNSATPISPIRPVPKEDGKQPENLLELRENR